MVIARGRALALLAAAPVFAPTVLSAQATTTLRVGAGLNDTFMQAHYGYEAGIFAKHGINLEITDLVNSAAQVAAAAGGALDFGMCDMIQLAAPIEKGAPLAYFAGGCLYRSEAPQTLLCVARESPYQKAKDLEGQTIGVVALNSLSSMSVTEWLTRGGVDMAKVKIFELPFATMVPGLLRGTVAAAFIGEPFVSGAKQDIRILASTYDTIAKEFYIGAWFGPKDAPQKTPDVLRRFTAALYETARWCSTHRDETALMLSKVSKLDLDRVKAMARTTFATTIDPKLMQPVIDIAVKYKLLAKRVNASELIMKVPL